VTAGNASGIVDGGAALILASDAAVKAKASSRWRGSSRGRRSVWIRPTWGWGRRRPRARPSRIAGLSLEQIDLIEVNEAFAGQYLAVEKELGLDRNKTNVNGGAIALGHPLGMTGTRLLLTLTHQLQQRGGKYGLATACIGGGQGIAAIVERL
jgi:acetyl-CoA acetyltransferase